MELVRLHLHFNLTGANVYLREVDNRQGNTLIHVNPLLTLDEANTSMKEAVDFAIAQGGTAVIEELSSWYQFFTKYVGAAQAVRIFCYFLLCSAFSMLTRVYGRSHCIVDRLSESRLSSAPASFRPPSSRTKRARQRSSISWSTCWISRTRTS